MALYTARTIQEILDEMIVDITARTDLYDATGADPEKLTNPSNASKWYNLLGTFATEVFILESELEDLETDLESRKLEIPTGTLRWHADETLSYQHGDTLQIIDGLPQYPVIDTAKQIVKYSSATEQSGVVLIKAAADDGSGNPIALTTLQKDGLTDYWVNKRFAGTGITVISQDGDEMVLTANVYVDGQKISSTGEDQANPGEYPVETAIKNYYKTLDFNGKFLVINVVDAIQAVDGVKNVIVSACQVKPFGAGSYINVLADAEESHIAVAGYIIEDTTTGLSSSLTYIQD